MGGALLRALKFVVQLLATGVGYFLAEISALQLAVAYPTAAGIWSPTGLAFAAVLLGGYRVLLAIFAAVFFANALSSGPSYAAGIAAANTLEACAFGFLIDGWAEGRDTFKSTTGIARFVPIAMCAAAVGAGIGTCIDLFLPGGSLPTESPSWAAFGTKWLQLWLGEVASGVVITPAIVLWATDRPRSFKLASLVEASTTVVAAGAVGALVFGPLTAGLPNRAGLGFLAILPLIWAALRGDPRDTATVGLVLSGCAVWGTMLGGPFAQDIEQPSPLLGMFMIVGTALSLLVATEVAARRRGERMLSTTRQDLRQAREQLAQWHKMEAIGQLTGGVAHDFNNLLTVIVGNLEMALRQMGSRTDAQTERLRRAINNARRGALRATAITQRLLAFSRKQGVEPRPLNANNLLAGLSDFLRRAVGETVTLDIIGADDLWTVEIDPIQLETAILNLAVNARDAMPAGGTVTISTANSFLDEEYCRNHEELAPGQYVQISVSDTGVGMSKDVLKRVFEPFFTTKETGRGTGLGLSQVYGFVKQSGGHVDIDSKPGAGTTVSMYLPRLPGHLADARAIERPVVCDDATPTILLVEDDHDVRAYVVEILRELHFRVLEAHDGDSALGLIDRKDVRLDLLLTDVVLPGMNGRQLAEAVRTRQPEIKVLFMSGYSRDMIVQDGALEPGIDVMRKPLTQEILEQRIRAVLKDDG